MKSPTIAPAYACLYPGLAEIARTHGYALAIHGSVSTDLDLIAVPWTDEASSAEIVAQAIRAHAAACLTQGCSGGNPEQKPHGRLAWHLGIEAGACIDLSVMPLGHSGDVATPNDPKLSHGGGWRGLCRWAERWWRSAAQAVTAGAVGCSAWLGVAVEVILV